MFRDKYKEHFNNIKPREELINKVKKEMLDIENSKKKKEVFINKKLVLSFAILALVLGVNYLTQFSQIKILEKNEASISTERINDERTDSEIGSLNNAEVVEENFKVNTESFLREENYINFGEVEHELEESSIALDSSNLNEEVLNYEEYLNYLGENPIPSYIPEGFILNEDLESLKINTFYNKAGEMVFDSLTLSYIFKESLGDKPSRSIDISVSKINYLDGGIDGRVIYTGDLETSIINNREVNLGYENLISKKMHSEEERKEINKNDEHSLYVAKFNKNGVYYIIKTCYLEKEEFLEILKSIL